MDFDFSPDQIAARDQLRKVLAQECPLSSVRAVATGHARFNAAAWRELGALGYLGAALPERYGGAGLGYLELCIAAEEIGRAIAPVPFNTSIAFVAEVIAACGSEQQKQVYLPRLATGEMIACVAPTASLPFAPALSGTLAAVLDGDIADLALIAVQEACGESLLLVDLRQPGVKRDSVRAIDGTRGHARLTLQRATADLLGERGGAQTPLRDARRRAAVLLAFEQLGGADRCLQLALDYARERRSFGRPIGSFQAIKHKLVDIYVRNTLARSHVYYGAWALSAARTDTIALAACAAAAAAGTAFLHAAQEAVQVFGAIGATWEHDAHLFQRRARLLASQWGGVHAWKDQLVTELDNGCGVVP